VIYNVVNDVDFYVKVLDISTGIVKFCRFFYIFHKTFDPEVKRRHINLSVFMLNNKFIVHRIFAAEHARFYCTYLDILSRFL